VFNSSGILASAEVIAVHHLKYIVEFTSKSKPNILQPSEKNWKRYITNVCQSKSTDLLTNNVIQFVITTYDGILFAVLFLVWFVLFEKPLN
jgi:hypothetical protein